MEPGGLLGRQVQQLRRGQFERSRRPEFASQPLIQRPLVRGVGVHHPQVALALREQVQLLIDAEQGEVGKVARRGRGKRLGRRNEGRSRPYQRMPGEGTSDGGSYPQRHVGQVGKRDHLFGGVNVGVVVFRRHCQVEHAQRRGPGGQQLGVSVNHRPLQFRRRHDGSPVDREVHPVPPRPREFGA